MSQERRRAREARDATRRRHLETAAAARARQERRAAVKDRLRPSLPRRRRRFGQLSTRGLAQVVVLWSGVQAAFWLLVPGLAQRGALAVISLAFLAVLVRTRKRPAR